MLSFGKTLTVRMSAPLSSAVRHSARPAFRCVPTATKQIRLTSSSNAGTSSSEIYAVTAPTTYEPKITNTITWEDIANRTFEGADRDPRPAYEKTPMELIAEIPPIKSTADVVACEGGDNPSVNHPIVYIKNLFHEPTTCGYCGLRYIRVHNHGKNAKTTWGKKPVPH